MLHTYSSQQKYTYIIHMRHFSYSQPRVSITALIQLIVNLYKGVDYIHDNPKMFFSQSGIMLILMIEKDKWWGGEGKKDYMHV